MPGDLAAVEALLAAGADANASLRKDYAPLTLAAKHGHDAILRACIRAGARALAKSSEFGGTPLNIAVSQGHDECTVTLLVVGAGAAQLEYEAAAWLCRRLSLQLQGLDLRRDSAFRELRSFPRVGS